MSRTRWHYASASRARFKYLDSGYQRPRAETAKDNQMSGPARGTTWAVLALTAALSLALTGCQSTMTTHSDEPRDTSSMKILPNEFPLRFRDHSFQAVCYNTIGCTVFYYKKYQMQHAPDKVAPPPINADYKKYWGSMEIAIPNFPPPAIVKWKSLDGVSHEAEVDIGGIFKDQLILHNVPEADIPEGWAHDISPNIFLEVNDRTISVYMQASIATKQEQTPGNRYSTFRDDMILAWSHAY